MFGIAERGGGHKGLKKKVVGVFFQVFCFLFFPSFSTFYVLSNTPIPFANGKSSKAYWVIAYRGLLIPLWSVICLMFFSKAKKGKFSWSMLPYRQTHALFCHVLVCASGGTAYLLILISIQRFTYASLLLHVLLWHSPSG